MIQNFGSSGSPRVLGGSKRSCPFISALSRRCAWFHLPFLCFGWSSSLHFGIRRTFFFDPFCWGWEVWIYISEDFPKDDCILSIPLSSQLIAAIPLAWMPLHSRRISFIPNFENLPFGICFSANLYPPSRQIGYTKGCECSSEMVFTTISFWWLLNSRNFLGTRCPPRGALFDKLKHKPWLRALSDEHGMSTSSFLDWSVVNPDPVV